MVERAWLVHVHKQVAQVKSPRSLDEITTCLNRIDLIEMSGGSVYLGLVV